jgi:hypothetical protein
MRPFALAPLDADPRLLLPKLGPSLWDGGHFRYTSLKSRRLR